MNIFLNKLCAERQTVRIRTINGYLMSGTITEVTEAYIVLDVNGAEQMVYIHAISTVRKAA